MARKLTKQEYEVYRKKAVELYKEMGLTQTQIADLLGVAQSAVSGWIKKSESGQGDWHKFKKGTGAPPKLSDEQFLTALDELAKGAVAHGFEGDFWTAARASAVIERLYGVKYDPDHLGRKLKKAKWSFKNPILKARQQSATKVAQWKEERLADLKKS